MEELRGRVATLKQALETFTLRNTLKHADIMAKMNIIMVHMTAIRHILNEKKDLFKELLLEPYSVSAQAELVPMVFLRTKLIPEIEEELSIQKENENAAIPVTNEGVPFDQLLSECAKIVDELRQEYKFAIKQKNDGEYTRLDELDKERKQTLKDLLSYFNSGKVQQES